MTKIASFGKNLCNLLFSVSCLIQMLFNLVQSFSIDFISQTSTFCKLPNFIPNIEYILYINT